MDRVEGARLIMATHAPTLAAAGMTDVGMQRVVNEDRFYADANRGVFVVIDGVGGQAAGGRAADIALATIKAHLAREGGPVDRRIREAITAANNDVHRGGLQRPELHGMACVLTVAVLTGDQAWVGHVGDTRLYKLGQGRLEKITPDHSPVGEREDAHEISELEAMRHPRRNEVYRDVGSEPHGVDDADFVDVRRVAFEPEAALLLCSDGLTDLVPSETIHRIVLRFAGRPDAVVRALVNAANDAGGKDNITVVYVEGARFARSRGGVASSGHRRGWKVAAAVLVAVASLAAAWNYVGWPVGGAVSSVLSPLGSSAIVVRATESIAAALAGAAPGSTVVVEPGEYREQLRLRDHVRVVSRVPRGAVLRLPATAAESEAAVIAVGITNGELHGFKIVGDAATPLGTGVLIRAAAVRLSDLEVSGAAAAAVDIGGPADVQLLASDIHDNAGAGLIARATATPRVVHNAFSRNGRGGASLVLPVQIETGATPTFERNAFDGVFHAIGTADIVASPPSRGRPGR